MFQRQFDENNKLVPIVNEFIIVFETILAFTNEDQREVIFTILNNIIEKMIFIKNVYGSSTTLPDLEKTFATNLNLVRSNIEGLLSSEPFDHQALERYLLAYQDGVIALYYKTAILGTYHSNTIKNQPSLTPEIMNEKLSAAILSLKSFFYNTHLNENNKENNFLNNQNLKPILSDLEMLIAVPNEKVSHYFIYVAAFLDQIKASEIPLSAHHQAVICDALRMQFETLKTEWYGQMPQEKINTSWIVSPGNNQLQNNELPSILIDDPNQPIPMEVVTPLTKKQKRAFTSEDNETEIVIETKTIFFEIFAYCGRRKIFPENKVVKGMVVIDDILIMYENTPQYFHNLPQTMLNAARNAKTMLINTLLPDSNISPAKDLESLYQNMVRRCFQMKICELYNNTLNNNSVKYKWDIALLYAVIQTLEFLQIKMNEVDKLKVKEVISTFYLIGNSLNFNHDVYFHHMAKSCVFALYELFIAMPEIGELNPKVLINVIETMKQLQAKLEILIALGLEEKNGQINPERMQTVLSELQPMEITFPLKPPVKLLTTKEWLKKGLAAAGIQQEPETSSSLVFQEKQEVEVDGRKAIMTTTVITGSHPHSLGIFKPKKTLEEIAKSKGFNTITIPGDGNCLYSSIAFLYQNQFPDLYPNLSIPDLAKKFRESAYAELKNHPEKYMGFVLAETDEYGKPKRKEYNPEVNYQDYLERIKQSGQWGDHPQIAALCGGVLKCKAIILYDIEDRQPFALGKRDATKIICLGHKSENHYDALLPSKPNSDAIEKLLGSSLPHYLPEDNVEPNNQLSSLSKK